MKIGPVDTEMALLIVKKDEITEGKIHSPVGRFAERAKLQLRKTYYKEIRKQSSAIIEYQSINKYLFV